jgi:hypothetical protein
MRFLNWFRPQLKTLVFQPRCSLCSRPSATIRVVSRDDGPRLVYDGPGGSSGSGGVPITQARVDAIAAAFVTPYERAKIKAAEFFDDAGFCESCECFYCPTHWNISTTGGGTCPKGHFKSLDPHWSPE